MIEKGIRNTRWYPSHPGLSVIQGMTWIISDFRDKEGMLWRSGMPLSVEILNDPGVVVPFLEVAWKEFKHILEHRYNELQSWDYHGLNTRSSKWLEEHPGAWDRIHGYEEELFE